MYISEIKLWNFRKYGNSVWDLDKPHLSIPFNDGLNVLIGENDSGKTAILDAIKIVLKTHAYEWNHIQKEDFYNDSSKLRIEILFKGLKSKEAKNFTEWLGWEGEGENARPVFRLIYEVEKKDNNILPSDVKAGMDETGFTINAEAREYLKSTYLKALRDADSELIAKKNSRISKILQGHDLFKEKEGDKHDFVKLFVKVNQEIQKWFECTKVNSDGKSNKELIKKIIDEFLQEFIDKSFSSTFTLSDPEINAILEKISLGVVGAKNPGLGTMNRLYMAAELLHLKKEWDGLKLCLIEELEAHLHPQAQMKIIETLQKEKGVQFITTTHSPNLASKVNIENLFICNGNDVYSLAKGKTKLEKENYSYLKRFLDVTKSNLFFAKGVIIVEGWSEEILIPAIADKIGLKLTENEVSIVNVGSTAYLHFAKIFLRNDGKIFKNPIAIVTDLDNKPNGDGEFNEEERTKKEDKIKKIEESVVDSNVKLFKSKDWTLEWCLFQSSTLSELFKESVMNVHNGTDDFKKINNEFDNDKFEKKLKEKLLKRTLDKVEVASILSEKIESSDNMDFINDEYIEYLIKSIKHACNANQ